MLSAGPHRAARTAHDLTRPHALPGGARHAAIARELCQALYVTLPLRSTQAQQNLEQGRTDARAAVEKRLPVLNHSTELSFEASPCHGSGGTCRRKSSPM